MRAQGRQGDCRGFTLIEVIASITIIAILAAVTLPRMTAARPFSERGYADTVAASLRQSRAVAIASGCAVEFTIDDVGYRALQRAAAGTHCAAAGGFVTPVRRGDGGDLVALRPADVVLGANRQLVFAPDGTVAAGPLAVNLGTRVVSVDASGVVTGP